MMCDLMIVFHTGETICDVYDPMLYINRMDVYAQQSNVGYIRQFKEVTDDVIAEHLMGIKTIGTYQIDLDNTVTWLCIDVDAHSEDEIASSKRKSCEIFCRLYERDIPFVVEASGSPHSYHFWLFLVRVDASKAYWFGRELLDDIVVEIYPKQEEITEDKQFGNLVKLPLGINNKTGVRSSIIYSTENLKYIDLNCYDESEYKWILNERQKQLIGKSNDNVIASDVRDCFQACANGEIVMTGTGGHTLRIGLTPELRLGAGMNEDEVVMAYKHQPDFDPEVTRYQVRSVWNYNRMTCKKIQTDAGHMIAEYCKECRYR